MFFVPSDGFIEKSLALGLFSPQAGTNEPHSFDNYEVGIGSWRQFVVHLKRDMIRVGRFENFTRCNGRGTFWTACNDCAILFFHTRFVMYLRTCFHGLTLHTLIDGVLCCTSFYNSVGNSIAFRLRDDIIRVNQVHNLEFCCSKLRCVKAPLLQLLKEISVH